MMILGAILLVGLMDTPDCGRATLSDCKDPSFASRCWDAWMKKCYGGQNDKILNLLGNGMGGGNESDLGGGGNEIEGRSTFGVEEDNTTHNTFKKIRLGTLCARVHMYEIETETKCKAAASQLGLQWGHAWNGRGDFPGCLIAEDGRNKVYFNTSPYPGRGYGTHRGLNPKYAAICQDSSDKECCKEIFVKPPKQNLSIGGYYKFYRMYNGRPAYKLSGSTEKLFLFYMAGSQYTGVSRWVIHPFGNGVIGPIYKSYKGYISHEGKQKCPNEVGKQWISYWTWNGQSKLVDPNVDVTCANSIVKYDQPLTTRWCKLNKDVTGRNGCMDDKQCLDNARDQCDKDPNCYGVSWYPKNRGQKLKLCLSRDMDPKTDGWRTIMKLPGALCPEGLSECKRICERDPERWTRKERAECKSYCIRKC